MPPDSWFFALKLCTALGCGLVAGVFFAFSTFVMQALGQQPPAQGIATMQAINITVINPWFMGVLFGTAAACVGLAIAAVIDLQHPSARWLLLGSLLYLVGAILPTGKAAIWGARNWFLDGGVLAMGGRCVVCNDSCYTSSR